MDHVLRERVDASRSAGERARDRCIAVNILEARQIARICNAAMIDRDENCRQGIVLGQGACREGDRQRLVWVKRMEVCQFSRKLLGKHLRSRLFSAHLQESANILYGKRSTKIAAEIIGVERCRSGENGRHIPSLAADSSANGTSENCHALTSVADIDEVGMECCFVRFPRFAREQ